MISLEQVEKDLVSAMKAKDRVAVDTLRGLKTRIQVALTSANGGLPSGQQADAIGDKNLSEQEIIALIRSEVKRRKEAATSFSGGGRTEMAEKELREAEILEKYLPAQMTEAKLLELIEATIAENNFAVKDFGTAMGKLKVAVGDQADGATLAKLLKEKLK